MRSIAVLAGFALTGMAPAPTTDVTVELTGAQAKPGKVFVGLYDRDSFFRSDPPYSTKVDAADGTVTVTFDDVEPGDYVMMAFHDTDQNGTITMGSGYMPAEPVAMSRQNELRSAPTFDLVKVAVAGERATMSEALRYP